MPPLFSIVTPSLQRESLKRCCDSIDAQSFEGWEHIIQIDCHPTLLKPDLLLALIHPNRRVFCCGTHHNNYGNSCRNLAWEKATGENLIYLDDDNYFSDEHILRDIAAIPRHMLIPEQWRVFPILRHGSVFFNDPPGLCKTDTMNVVVKREVGRWPDIPDYCADGHWVENLKQYPYQAFPNFRPIGVMEKSNEGRP